MICHTYLNLCGALCKVYISLYKGYNDLSVTRCIKRVVNFLFKKILSKTFLWSKNLTRINQTKKLTKKVSIKQLSVIIYHNITKC